MNNQVDIYTSSENQFYPTPMPLIEKMLSDIDWNNINSVLEPSAGKGDLVAAALVEKVRHYSWYSKEGLDVDCIEIDENLRGILKYNFSDEMIDELNKKKKISHDNDALKIRIKALENSTVRIIHDDFLTYPGYEHYDLILMNPPFANGDLHLLKALEMQKNGGNIICILNAETLKNPFTERRNHLVKRLKELNAQIEFISNAFVSAERKTNVDIALIKVSIKPKVEKSDIYEKFKNASNLNTDDIPSEITDIAVTDFIKMIVSMYNVEVQSGIELIRQYRAMIPHIYESFDDTSGSKKPILRLTDSTDRGYDSVSINGFVKKVRYKYWSALLSNPNFVGKLTSNLQQEYYSKIRELKNYEFSEFNIKILSADMNCQMIRGVEDAIMALFDRMTVDHTYYPECKNNKHYYNGWCHNKAHKINKKIIMPCHGVFYEKWYGGDFRSYEAIRFLTDIEKVFNFLDGGLTRDVNLEQVIQCAEKANNPKNIECKFFRVSFYKKGTCHIVFTNLNLLDKFNIYASQRKGWLPPNYGKTAYSNMTHDEKTIIDEFQGEDSYNNVFANRDYFLQETKNMIPMLSE